MGVDFSLRAVDLGDVVARLQLWVRVMRPAWLSGSPRCGCGTAQVLTHVVQDVAGQERFSSMGRAYFRDAKAAFVVFDVTRDATFRVAEGWKADIDDKVSAGVAQACVASEPIRE